MKRKKASTSRTMPAAGSNPCHGKRLAQSRRILLFAALHYGVLLCLGGLIFFCSHLPTTIFNLDPLTSALVSVEDILVAPRRLLLWLWPLERTPRLLGPATTALNSLLWGFSLALLARLRHRPMAQ